MYTFVLRRSTFCWNVSRRSETEVKVPTREPWRHCVRIRRCVSGHHSLCRAAERLHLPGAFFSRGGKLRGR